MALVELLEKAGDGDFLRAVAEAVLQILMDAEVEGLIGVARSTVQDNLKRAETAGLAWPLGAEITHAILEQHLSKRAGVRPGVRGRIEPDWSSLVHEAKRPGVNLMVLWEEYREVHPDGYGYSRSCDLFREF